MKKKMQKGQQTEKVRAEAQTVKVDDHGLFNPYANYAYYLLTALLPMMLQMDCDDGNGVCIGCRIPLPTRQTLAQKGWWQSAKSLNWQTSALYLNAPLCRVVDELSPFWTYRRTPPHPDVQRSAYHFCFSHHLSNYRDYTRLSPT